MASNFFKTTLTVLRNNTNILFCLLLLCHCLLPSVLGNAAESKTPDEIIGIDLGTTYSCVGVLKEDHVDIIANDQGGRTTASWVALAEDGTIYVGDAAKSHAQTDPAHTFFDSKRLIGRTFEEVKSEVKKYPFKVVNRGGKPVYETTIKGKVEQFSPEEVSAKILIKMKETAEAALGKEVKKAVITVPAYFNDSQRQATKDAGQIAKLDVVRILNEPTAAALAYGLDKQGSSTILVYDLGGGTFDVSLLEVSEGVFEVKSTSGDTHLGGQDFDENVMKWAFGICKSKYNVDIEKNNKLLNKLRREAEKAKIILSSAPKTLIEVDGIGNGQMFSETLTRAKFEELNKQLFSNTLKSVENALKDAKKAKKDVDHVVLVGGSTRIPKVQELLSKYFDGKELDKSVNPDEAVAQGAALQAGIIMGARKTKEMLVIDTNPLSLGIETLHGIFTKIIERNTPIPTRKVQQFSTADDNQTQVTIKVYEGERNFAKDNHLLGTFDLSGIPLAPRGVPKIEVVFEIDVNGILTVTAKDQGSGNAQSIRISNEKGRLSQAEIERMIKEAEKHSEEDKQRRDVVEAQDQFERYIYQLKDQVNDEHSLGGKISASEKSQVLEAVEEGQKWMDTNRSEASKEDYAEQRSKIEKIVGPIVTKLYGEAKGAPSDQEEHDEL